MRPMDNSVVEVAIVGGGPVGIELAVALKAAGVPYVHFEAGQVGATMTWWPPGTRWFSSNERIAIAGVPLSTADQGKATREEYLRYLRDVVTQFDLAIRTFEPVTAIRRAGDAFELTTRPVAGERSYRARRVVLATGGTARPRRLDVEGEDLPHVSHYMADPHLYFRRRVLVVGGRNSAVEAALRLHQVGARVELSYRGADLSGSGIKYWLLPEIVSLLRQGRIPGHFRTVVRRITPEAVELEPCGPEGRAARVEADAVLLMVGYVADMTLARLAGVTLEGDGEVPRYDERTMETNVPGLYVAGTAIAGTQSRYKVFLENCHVHVGRIVRHITGSPPPFPTPAFGTSGNPEA